MFRVVLAFSFAMHALLGSFSYAESADPLPPSTVLQPPASYGSLTAKLRTDHQPVVLPSSVDWRSSRYAMISSELSPAVLYHNRTKEQRLFSGLDQWRLGGPTALAYTGPNSTLQIHSAQNLTLPRPELTQPWLLVWFKDARGWGRWDSPWLVVLQHQPSSITLDSGGLRISFPKEAGITAAMPLFGYFKPAHSPNDPGALLRLPDSPKVHTDDWIRTLPPEVLPRIHWWSRVLRAYPLHCRETFSVDRMKDRLTLREEFTWLPIKDDWNTPPIKFAPLSPSLALAYGDERFPMTLDENVTDPGLMTPYGPYLGVEGKDRFDVHLDVLQYVHETEVRHTPDTEKYPQSKDALDLVVSAMRSKFAASDGSWSVDFGKENFCWAAMSDRYYPKGLAYADPQTQENARKSLRNYFADWVLKEERFKPFQGMLLLVGPGIGTWGGYDDAGKFSSNLLETIWSYAHYTEDWDLIRERWPIIQLLFITPLESDWKIFGRAAIAEMGDEAAPPLAMARMAYRIGDADMYHYACYIFGREILHHFIKQNGADYFRRRQPYHSMEPMLEEVYLTNLWGDTAGWQIDGPAYPEVTGERQFNNRWVRFGNEDVARFHRDHLMDDSKRELDTYVERGTSPYNTDRDDGHIAPSMQRLRSLLLNESPAQLAKLNPLDKITIQPESGKVAVGLAFIRTSRTPLLARIIPKEGRPSSFLLGLERQVEGGFSGLVQNPVWEARPKEGETEAFWPTPVWHFWKPPVSIAGHPAGERWPFGESRPEEPDRPASGKTTRLNWNTQVTTFAW